MTLGASFLLIAVGAILKFAVTDRVNGVDVGTVGVILMIVGAAGLLLGLILMTSRRRTDVISRPGHTTYVEPNDPQL
ncbi:MAG: hypothetical protein JWO63_3129 [Frankiales bacterium]|nr:hypothetical protein [Frankiales bacterium]